MNDPNYPPEVPVEAELGDPSLLERAHRALAMVEGIAESWSANRLQWQASGQSPAETQKGYIEHAGALALLSIAESLDVLVAGPAAELGSRFLADMELAEHERAQPAPAARLARYVLTELGALNDVLDGLADGTVDTSDAEGALTEWSRRVGTNVRDELGAAT